MTIGVEPLRRWVLWLFLAVSAFAAIEPSPYEAMFFVALLAFAPGGLRFDRRWFPLIVSLALYNAGGLLSLAPWVDESESVTFIAISIYISLTTIFFAAVVAAAPAERMETIRSGYVFAGLVAAVLGILRLLRRRRHSAPISPSTTTRGRWARSRTPTSSARSWSRRWSGCRRTCSCGAAGLGRRAQADRPAAGAAAEFLARRGHRFPRLDGDAARPHFPYRHARRATAPASWSSPSRASR